METAVESKKESEQLETREEDRTVQYALVAGLLVFHTLLAILGWLLMAVRPFGIEARWFYVFGLGVAIGQAGVCAVWSVLAMQNFVARMSFSVVGIFAAFISVFMLFLIESNSHDEALLFSSIVWLQFFVLQGPLWLMRSLAGWRIAFDSPDGSAKSNPVQFGLRQMIIWTTVFAVLLALGRLLGAFVKVINNINVIQANEEWVMAFAMGLTGVFLTLVLAGACLVRRLVISAILGGLVVCAVISLLEIVVFRISMGAPAGESMPILFSINAATVLTMLVSFVVLRIAGLNLWIVR